MEHSGEKSVCEYGDEDFNCNCIVLNVITNSKNSLSQRLRTKFSVKQKRTDPMHLNVFFRQSEKCEKCIITSFVFIIPMNMYWIVCFIEYEKIVILCTQAAMCTN